MQDLNNLIDTFVKAEKSNDINTLKRVLSDDFVAIGPLGFTLTKEQWLQRHQGDIFVKAFDISEIKTVYSNDMIIVAIAREGMDVEYQGKPMQSDLRATLVFIR